MLGLTLTFVLRMGRRLEGKEKKPLLFIGIERLVASKEDVNLRVYVRMVASESAWINKLNLINPSHLF